MNRVVIQECAEPATDGEFSLLTGIGNDLYPALDRFDRIVNLVWKRGARKLIDYAYKYDRSGIKNTPKVNDSPPPTNVDLIKSICRGQKARWRFQSLLFAKRLRSPSM